MNFMGVHLYTNGAWTDSGRIYRNSNNIFDISTWNNVIVTRGTYSIDGTRITITSTGADCYTETYNQTRYNIPCVAGETYTFSWDTNITSGTVYAFTGTTVANTVARVVASNLKKGTFTVPEGHTVMSLRVGISSEGITGYYDNIKIEKGSDSTPYEPYNVVDWYTNHGHGYSSGAWS